MCWRGAGGGGGDRHRKEKPGALNCSQWCSEEWGRLPGRDACWLEEGVISRAGGKRRLCELTEEAAVCRNLRSHSQEREGFHFSPPGSWVGGPKGPFTETLARAPPFQSEELGTGS